MSRELDAEVAQVVFGKTCRWTKDANGVVEFDTDGFDVPEPYSTDLQAAWKVVEHCKSQDWCVDIHTGGPQRGFYCGFSRPWMSRIDFFNECPTVEEAICLSALMALRKSEERRKLRDLDKGKDAKKAEKAGVA